MHVSQNVMVKMSLMTSSVREAVDGKCSEGTCVDAEEDALCSKGTCEDTVCSLLFSIDYDNECAAECDGSDSPALCQEMFIKMVQRATCLYVYARIQSCLLWWRCGL
eukprot:845328_1